MTCVVALSTDDGRLVLGGDSFCGDEQIVDLCRAPKVYRVGPVGIGLCGNVRSEQILERTVKYHVPRAKVTEKWIKNNLTDHIRKAMKKHGCLTDDDGQHSMKESQYLLTFNGKIYFFEEDFALWDSSRQCAAIGAGKLIAYGALSYAIKHGHHNEDPCAAVKDALDTATEWSPWVCGPHTILEIGND